MDDKWKQLMEGFGQRVNELKKKEAAFDKRRKAHNKRHKLNQRKRRQRNNREEEDEEEDMFDDMYEQMHETVCGAVKGWQLLVVVSILALFSI